MDFVSALGPGKEPDGPDVRFHRSVPKYADALLQKQLLESKQFSDPSLYEVVIYRVSYDGTRFYSSRQVEESKQGTERHAGEPEELEAIAFDLFSAPKDLPDLSPDKRADQSELSFQVERIYKNSLLPRPGSVGQ